MRTSEDFTIPEHLNRRFLRPDDAAELIEAVTGVPTTRNALAVWRTRGNGPRFHKPAGRRSVVYGRDDVVSWAMASLGKACSSTSQLEAAE